MDFSSQSIKQLIYLILLASIAFAGSSYLCANSQNHWFIWSALIVSLIVQGNNFSQRLLLLFGTGLVAAIAVFLSGIATIFIPVLAIYLFLISIYGFFLGEHYSEYFLPPLIIVFFAILGSEIKLPLPLNADRTLYILAGTLLAIVLQIIFLPGFVRNQFRFWIARVLYHLSRLVDEIFQCFLHPEYADNIYLFERRVHVQKQRYLQSIAKLREIEHSAERKMHLGDKQVVEEVIKQLEHLFDGIIDCAQLRKRVTDHSTFQLCSDELREIEAEIEKNFQALMTMKSNKKTELDVSLLANKIKRFEENYSNVLQVTSREPLVFLLFITSLNALCESFKTTHASLFALHKWLGQGR